jgi:hypothetical protein
MRHTKNLPQTHLIALMLTFLTAAVLALTIEALGPSAVAQAEEPNMAILPTEVREALDRATRIYAKPLSGARWSHVSRLSGTDHPIYQVRGMNGRGNKIEIEVTSAGRVIEVEEHGIGISEVPGAVIEAFRAKLPDFEPTLVEAIYQAGKSEPVSYGFEGKDDAGKKIEIYISADGRTFLN